MINRLADRKLIVDRNELHHLMGYPHGQPISPPIQEVINEQLAQLDGLAQPWGTWLEIPIECIDGEQIRLTDQGCLRSRRLSKILRKSSAIRLILATLGPRVSEKVRQYTDDGDMLEALALDSAATAAISSLMEGLQADSCKDASSRGLGSTLRYGPGYTEWELSDIEVLFNYLPKGQVPVRLNDQHMMIPEKSLLAIVGLVPGGRSESPKVDPCRICDLKNCVLRKQPYGESRKLD
ncbi:hypothetical protein [Denitratisoma oestradiolicum]|uniref:AdoMet activation domain-containing protein n=1 Tax=Denitratisoma oestradiolicum TaxID=311182 RepID=A0A6S6Y767_9PROT|nr:hypothetical protein [Denitratisoma oestradiolicum]TWO79012.1 hypothetical protein CBW56_16950 [Denitratisoma oestradiolicum]CAB1368328.1 conserved protein of unknown function [Denitratisoma oestradiolicum]